MLGSSYYFRGATKGRKAGSPRSARAPRGSASRPSCLAGWVFRELPYHPPLALQPDLPGDPIPSLAGILAGGGGAVPEGSWRSAGQGWGTGTARTEQPHIAACRRRGCDLHTTSQQRRNVQSQCLGRLPRSPGLAPHAGTSASPPMSPAPTYPSPRSSLCSSPASAPPHPPRAAPRSRG